MRKLKQSGLWLDPRTKAVILILCILSAALAPSITYNCGLVLLTAILALSFGRTRAALLGAAGYVLICLMTAGALKLEPGTLKTMFIAAFGLFHKVYPCGMLSGVLLSTTKASEFLSAMSRIHAPKTLTVSLAVMLRYLPAVREDWGCIKDAMRLRDVAPSLGSFLCHPAMTAECLYVPLMMSASKAADELSIAAVTRGIENPRPRSCMVRIRFGPADAAAVMFFLIYLLAGQFWKGVFV
ncbi:energy-coupling factor transporter transmembrane protein EcfT [Ruminococcus sp. OA3]|uniref:energy-coupling factor transporter transmembrane component T n=1 Tax=Ruminococcus sp. OA3 TaxID=2914164 RepID=UPI001F06ADD2|nr:energy-coupling factor transporter transmembrane component T [Ruminococcus sp. OA3]MCH1983143.1 energy-coupling factor transporter transmembrane protein EcfT [Ruminococcus sp. OA3]